MSLNRQRSLHLRCMLSVLAGFAASSDAIVIGQQLECWIGLQSDCPPIPPMFAECGATSCPPVIAYQVFMGQDPNPVPPAGNILMEPVVTQ